MLRIRTGPDTGASDPVQGQNTTRRYEVAAVWCEYVYVLLALPIGCVKNRSHTSR
jgi:hypothetical protein